MIRIGAQRLAGEGRLRETLMAGKFAVTFEISPPRGASRARMRRQARAVRDWVDAANVTDGQGAQLRVASWAGCWALIEEGVEPVMQLQCRDRNRIALQSDLLGAAAVDIPNVLLMTGDDQRFGDQPEAKGVFDLDGVQLIQNARRMRDERKVAGGRTLATAPNWFIGCAEDPFAAPREFRAQRLAKKIAAGAEFAQTQYVYDLGVFRTWMAQVRDLGLDERCFILAGVGPIVSQPALDRLNGLPGLWIPEAVERRLRGVPEDRAEAEGIALCSEIIEELKEIPGVAGVHLIAADLEERVPEILRRAGLGPREQRLRGQIASGRRAPAPQSFE